MSARDTVWAASENRSLRNRSQLSNCDQRMALFLGIDVSTTATKALLIDQRGRVAATAAQEYELSTPKPLWSEQSPEDWWSGAASAVRGALQRAGVRGDAVRGIGLTGQMHGLVLLDEAGQVLRPAILWNDQRSERQCEQIRQRVGHERLVQITGNDAFAGFTAPKILWVRDNEPDVYARIAHVLLPKDYVRYRLTGEYATDRAGAGGTLLLDLSARSWSDEVLERLDILRAWLPPTSEGPEITGHVSAAAAAETGLKEGTPVVAGGGDQAAQAVGVGAVRAGIVALTLGTSGVVFTTTETPLVEPLGRIHSFPHAVPQRWHVMGVMLSAAGSLRWYRDTTSPHMSYDALLAEAESAPPGAEAVYFMPYLSGERTPHADAKLRGAFVGLTLKHERAHMTRAVLEGVAFGIRDNLELLGSVGVPAPEQVRVSGGGARSLLWRKIFADVLNTELVSVQTEEGAAYGAAILAGVGAGAWKSVEAACDEVVTTSDTVTPTAEGADVYKQVHKRFTMLYPALRPFYHHEDG